VPQRLGKVHTLLVMVLTGVYPVLVLGVEQQYLLVMEPIGVYLLLVLGVQHQSVTGPLCPPIFRIRINRYFTSGLLNY
jgi:hypothetical protein